ncbi:hypothetical protein IH574_04720, partial [Candidatus Bathyarchaeota archaeon]|nr:hypothetical protein [Candidatus Bathyarchaeota archaeon]
LVEGEDLAERLKRGAIPVAEALEITEKKAYSLLKNMFQADRAVGYKDEDGQRKYRNSEEETVAALKRKAKDDKKAAKSD